MRPHRMAVNSTEGNPPRLTRTGDIDHGRAIAPRRCCVQTVTPVSKPSFRVFGYHSGMPHDTSADAERVQLDLLRRMTPAEKAQLVSELTLAVQQLAFAGIRQMEPAASDDEIWLRLASRRLGSDTVRKVYAFDPDAK